MAEKPFLLFGKREPSKIDVQEERLRELESAVSEKRKEQSAIKRESERVVAEAERRIEVAKREESALKSLRAEISKRVRNAEKREQQLRELGKSISEREHILSNEAAKLQRLKDEESRLRLEISALEHAFDERKSAMNEREKAVLTLTKELGGLVQKRNEFNRFETGVAQLESKERELKKQVSKIEQRVADGAKLISRQQEDTEHYKQHLKELKRTVDQASTIKKQIDAEFAGRQKKMLQAERELADMEDAVKNVIITKDELAKKSAILSQRERQLVEQERRIDAKNSELGSKKSEFELLKEEAASAQRTKQEMFGLVEEKKRILEELRSSISQNSRTMQELHERERSARKAEHDLLAAQHGQDKKLKLLETKEKVLITRETNFVEHEKGLKEAARMLEKQKNEFQDEVNARKAEFLLIQQEWDKKVGDLEQEKKELRSEKTDVRKLVESDVLTLKDKEEELVQTIAMLERDKRKLQEEETSLIRRVRELEHAKSVFDRAKRGLEDKEKRIAGGERIVQKGMKFIETEKRRVEQEKDVVYRSRELKKILPKMEKRYEELQHTVRRMETRAMEVGTRPSASRLFRERESVLALKEKGIELETRKLMEREHEAENLESRKERAFSEYLREEVERVQLGKPGRELVNPEIHAMIDDAREKVMQGSLDEAVRLVAQAEYLVDKVQNPNQKRILMYDIKDLKASIKLATLT